MPLQAQGQARSPAAEPHAEGGDVGWGSPGEGLQGSQRSLRSGTACITPQCREEEGGVGQVLPCRLAAVRPPPGLGSDGCGDTDPLQGGTPLCPKGCLAAGQAPGELQGGRLQSCPKCHHLQRPSGDTLGTHLSVSQRRPGCGGAPLPRCSHSPHRDHPLLRPIPQSTSTHSLTGTRRAAGHAGNHQRHRAVRRRTHRAREGTTHNAALSRLWRNLHEHHQLICFVTFVGGFDFYFHGASKDKLSSSLLRTPRFSTPRIC